MAAVFHHPDVEAGLVEVIDQFMVAGDGVGETMEDDQLLAVAGGCLAFLPLSRRFRRFYLVRRLALVLLVMQVGGVKKSALMGLGRGWQIGQAFMLGGFHPAFGLDPVQSG